MITGNGNDSVDNLFTASEERSLENEDERKWEEFHSVSTSFHYLILGKLTINNIHDIT